MSRLIRIWYGILALLVILACAPVLVPSSAPVPTFDPNSINTVIALTANSAATQTAQMLPPTLTPTVTLIPAKIFTPTETPTATFLFALPTFTFTPTQIQPGSSGAQYECQIISQTPAENSNMPKGSPFEALWRVANIGTDEWNSDNTDYRYISGTKFHLTGIYDLNQSVAPGESTDIVVKMQAPAESGKYSTRWKITVGKNQFCTMQLTLNVN